MQSLPSQKMCRVAQGDRALNAFRTSPDYCLSLQPPGNSRCEACKKSCRYFTYHCSSCDEFDIVILCAFLNRNFKHKSHTHPLMLLQRPVSLECNACDEKLEDESYACNSCPFWIHKSCGLLPETHQHKDHDHPLRLAYSLPIQHRGYRLTCELCEEKLQTRFWVYHCGPVDSLLMSNASRTP